jgi:hypothetical protein
MWREIWTRYWHRSFERYEVGLDSLFTGLFIGQIIEHWRTMPFWQWIVLPLLILLGLRVAFWSPLKRRGSLL